MKEKIKNLKISDIMPFAILAIFLVVFGISTGGTLFSGANLINLVNQSVAILLCALGMVFVSSMGGTDITAGSLLAMAAIIGFKVSEVVGWGAFVPVTLLVGLLSGLLLGVINAVFKVPSFMASLALLIAYRAYANLSLKSAAFSFYKELSIFNNFAFNVISVIVMIALVIYVFHYTPFGTYIRGIGENENAMGYTGMNVKKVKIAAFVISGFIAALAGIFLCARVGGVSNTLGTGFEMKVMMAMFIGGIPVEGGMGSKIYKLVIGAPTITLLENGLVLSGVDGAVTQLIRGVILLAVIWLTMYANDKFRYGFHKKNSEKLVE